MPPYNHIDRPSPFAPMSGEALPVWVVSSEDIEQGNIDAVALAWARAAGFRAAEGAVLLVPGQDGKLAGALFGLGDEGQCHPFIGGKLARALPEGDWRIETSSLAGKPWRSPSAWEPTGSKATAKLLHRARNLPFPKLQTPMRSIARWPGFISPAIWSTRPPMTWGRMRWKRLSAVWRITTRPK